MMECGDLLDQQIGEGSIIHIPFDFVRYFSFTRGGMMDPGDLRRLNMMFQFNEGNKNEFLGWLWENRERGDIRHFLGAFLDHFKSLETVPNEPVDRIEYLLMMRSSDFRRFLIYKGGFFNAQGVFIGANPEEFTQIWEHFLNQTPYNRFMQYNLSQIRSTDFSGVFWFYFGFFIFFIMQSFVPKEESTIMQFHYIANMIHGCVGRTRAGRKMIQFVTFLFFINGLLRMVIGVSPATVVHNTVSYVPLLTDFLDVSFSTLPTGLKQHGAFLLGNLFFPLLGDSMGPLFVQTLVFGIYIMQGSNELLKTNHPYIHTFLESFLPAKMVGYIASNGIPIGGFIYAIVNLHLMYIRQRGLPDRPMSVWERGFAQQAQLWLFGLFVLFVLENIQFYQPAFIYTYTPQNTTSHTEIMRVLKHLDPPFGKHLRNKSLFIQTCAEWKIISGPQNVDIEPIEPLVGYFTGELLEKVQTLIRYCKEIKNGDMKNKDSCITLLEELKKPQLGALDALTQEKIKMIVLGFIGLFLSYYIAYYQDARLVNRDPWEILDRVGYDITDGDVEYKVGLMLNKLLGDPLAVSMLVENHSLENVTQLYVQVTKGSVTITPDDRKKAAMGGFMSGMIKKSVIFVPTLLPIGIVRIFNTGKEIGKWEEWLREYTGAKNGPVIELKRLLNSIPDELKLELNKAAKENPWYKEYLPSIEKFLGKKLADEISKGSEFLATMMTQALGMAIGLFSWKSTMKMIKKILRGDYPSLKEMFNEFLNFCARLWESFGVNTYGILDEDRDKDLQSIIKMGFFMDVSPVLVDFLSIFIHENTEREAQLYGNVKKYLFALCLIYYFGRGTRFMIRESTRGQTFYRPPPTVVPLSKTDVPSGKYFSYLSKEQKAAINSDISEGTVGLFSKKNIS